MKIAVVCALALAVSQPLSFSQVPAPADTTSDVRRQQADAAFAEAERALTIRLVDRYLAQANSVATLLADVKAKSKDLDDKLKTLQTNDDGKRLAAGLDAISARQLQRLIDEPPAKPDQIQTAEKELQSVVDSLKKLRNSPPAGFVPPDGQQDELLKMAIGLQDSSARLKERSTWLNDLMATAPKQVDLAKSPTLADALKDFHRREQIAWNEAQRVGIAQAQPEAADQIAAAAKTAELERALEYSRQMLSDTRADLERMRIDQQMRVDQMLEDQRQREDALKKKLADAQAARTLQDAQNQVTVQKAQQDADMAKKRQQCHDPAVTAALGPLIAKGYWQPQSGKGIEALPMSLSELRSVGALTPTKDGVQKLMTMGNGNPNDRPHWGKFYVIANATGPEIETVRTAQKYLIDLGEALVLENLLSK